MMVASFGVWGFVLVARPEERAGFDELTVFCRAAIVTARGLYGGGGGGRGLGFSRHSIVWLYLGIIWQEHV